MLKKNLSQRIQQELSIIYPSLKSKTWLGRFASDGIIGVIKKWLLENPEEDQQIITESILDIFSKLLGDEETDKSRLLL